MPDARWQVALPCSPPGNTFRRSQMARLSPRNATDQTASHPRPRNETRQRPAEPCSRSAGKSPSPSMQAPIRRSASPALVPLAGKPDYGCLRTLASLHRSGEDETVAVGERTCSLGQDRQRTRPVARPIRMACCHDWQQQDEGVRTLLRACELRLVMTCPLLRKGGLDKFRKGDPAPAASGQRRAIAALSGPFLALGAEPSAMKGFSMKR